MSAHSSQHHKLKRLPLWPTVCCLLEKKVDNTAKGFYSCTLLLRRKIYFHIEIGHWGHVHSPQSHYGTCSHGELRKKSSPASKTLHGAAFHQHGLHMTKLNPPFQMCLNNPCKICCEPAVLFGPTVKKALEPGLGCCDLKAPCGWFHGNEWGQTYCIITKPTLPNRPATWHVYVRATQSQVPEPTESLLRKNWTVRDMSAQS